MSVEIDYMNWTDGLGGMGAQARPGAPPGIHTKAQEQLERVQRAQAAARAPAPGPSAFQLALGLGALWYFFGRR